MPRGRSFQTEAIVIRKVKLGEADRILTLYTPQLGKIRAVAKGVRKPKSKMSGHLELLTHSLVSLVKGRNLDSVTGCQTIHGFLPLKTDLERAAGGLYVAELVDQFTADEDGNPPLFQLLLDTLQSLAGDNNREMALRFFELRLLEETGYRPEFEVCTACHASLEAASWFSASAGGLICPACRQNQTVTYRLSVGAIKSLQFIQGNDYETVSRLKLDAALANEVEEVLRRYLKYLLEREIKSAAWLDTLKKQSGRTGA